jgi:CDP-diacylglycerol--glycerol-3-phosphate 3-phosphatidyltransferase
MSASACCSSFNSYPSDIFPPRPATGRGGFVWLETLFRFANCRVAFAGDSPLTDRPAMTTANKITCARILLIPVFVMMVIYYGKGVQRGDPQDWQRIAAILAFLLAAASDGLDGYIARHYNQRSKLGVVLDPIADKGLLLSAVITLSVSKWSYELPAWFPVLVITRDAVIVLGVLIVHYLVGEAHVKPSWLGKTATALQMVAISLVLLQLDLFQTTLHVAGWKFPLEFLDIPVVLAGFFTLVSGIGYVMQGIHQLQEEGHAHAK